MGRNKITWHTLIIFSNFLAKIGRLSKRSLKKRLSKNVSQKMCFKIGLASVPSMINKGKYWIKIVIILPPPNTHQRLKPLGAQLALLIALILECIFESICKCI